MYCISTFNYQRMAMAAQNLTMNDITTLDSKMKNQ